MRLPGSRPSTTPDPPHSHIHSCATPKQTATTRAARRRQGVVVRNLVLDHTGFKEAVHCCMEGGGSPGAGPLLQGLEIKCSGDDGVNASGRARLTLADCRLRAKKSAIRAYGDARVVARDCVAEACGEAGVKVMDAAALACERCVVAGCQEEAAVVMDSGTLTCRDCTLRDCKGPGLDVSGSGRARLTQTDIHDNVGGVWLWDAGAAEAAHCKLEGGPSFALMADTDARAAPKAALQVGGQGREGEEGRKGGGEEPTGPPTAAAPAGAPLCSRAMQALRPRPLAEVPRGGQGARPRRHCRRPGQGQPHDASHAPHRLAARGRALPVHSKPLHPQAVTTRAAPGGGAPPTPAVERGAWPLGDSPATRCRCSPRRRQRPQTRPCIALPCSVAPSSSCDHGRTTASLLVTGTWQARD